MKNLDGLNAAIKLLADGVKDVIAVVQPGQSLSQKIADFENLVPDAMAAMGVIGDVSAEFAALTGEDIANLAVTAVTDAAFSGPKAQAIAAAAINVIKDQAVSGVPDILAFIAAVKS